MLARDYAHSPAASFSGWIATQWSRLFGWGFYSMRCLAITLNEIGLLACGYGMYRLTHRLSLTMFVTGISAYLMSFYFTTGLYGWDNASTCFIVLTLVAMLFALYSPALWKWILIGVFSAFAIMSRLPDACIVPLVLLFIVFGLHGNVKCKVIGIVTYLFTAGMVTAAILLGIFGSFENWRAELDANMVSAHGIENIIMGIPWSTIEIWPYLMLPVGLFTIIYACGRGKFSRWLYIALIALGSVYFFSYMYLFCRDKSCEMLGNINSGFLILSLAYAYIKAREKGIDNIVPVAAVFLFSFAGLIGSNTLMVKHLSVILFPLCIGLCVPFMSMSFKIFAIIFALTTGCFGPINKRNGLYWDEGMEACTAVPKHPIFSGVRTTPARVAQLNFLTDVIHNVGDDDFMCVSHGADRFIVDYMKGARSPYFQNSWDGNLLNDSTYVNLVKEHITHARRPVTVVVLRAAPEYGQSAMEKSCYAIGPDEISEHGRILCLRYLPGH